RGVLQNAETKAKQDALFDPCVDAPARRQGGIRRGGANFATFEGGTQRNESVHRGRIANGGRAGGIKTLNGRLDLINVHCILSLSRQGPENAKPQGMQAQGLVAMGWVQLRRKE